MDTLQRSWWMLEFLDEGQSFISSEPQVVEGTEVGAGLSLVSNPYELTVAIPVFGCSVEPGGKLSARDRLEQQIAYQRWQASGRTERNRIIFDFSSGQLQFDASGKDIVFHLTSGEGAVTLRRAEGSREESEARSRTGKRTLSNLSLEIRRGQDSFECIERMSLSFIASPIDKG